MNNKLNRPLFEDEDEIKSTESKPRSVIKKLAIAILVVLIAVKLSLIIFVIVTIARCYKEPSYEIYGDFKYDVVYYDENGEHVAEEESVRSGILLRNLSKEGKKKEIIVIPEYINNIKVTEIGGRVGIGAGLWKSDKLKKVFVPSSVFIYHAAFHKCDNLEKVILFGHDKSYYISNGEISNKDGYLPVYLTSYYYITEQYTTNQISSDYHEKFYFSNVSFRYNYDNAPKDGYYWIDDCDYGSVIEYIPKPPTREGYTFEGWYKESECINKWEFEKDTLPQAQYTEDNKEIYQETKLYAKWIKN